MTGNRFPSAGDYGQLPNGYFTPDIWEPNLLMRFYEESVIPNIVNMDYEGTIRKFGDTVNIRREAEVQINPYTKGQALVHQVVTDEEVQLLINNGAYWCIPVDDVDVRQADVNFVNALQKNAARQHKRYVDKLVFSTIYSDPQAANVMASQTVSASNLPELLVNAGVILDNAFVPDDNRWMVVPYWMRGLLKLNPTFVDADKMGDDKSIIKGGLLGKFDRFEIYTSPWLALVTGYTQVVFGRTSGITFATQFIKTETLRNQWTFGDVIRGLQVFGYKTTRPDHVGKVGVIQG